MLRIGRLAPATPHGRINMGGFYGLQEETPHEETTMTDAHRALVMEESRDPHEVAQAHAQAARLARNATWLQAHAADIYPRYRGQHICIAGEELFVAATPDEAWALATAAHPDDDGRFLYYIPVEAVARIYVY